MGLQGARASSCIVQLASDKITLMSVRAREIFLLVAMLWQSLCVLSPLSVAQRAEDFGHLTMHAQLMDHHHHEDHAVHRDHSGVASQHQHVDGGVNQAGWLPMGWSNLVTLKPLFPAGVVVARVPSPDLEGLLRPPRHNA